MPGVYENIYRVYDALQGNHEENITMQVAKNELLDLVNQMPEECELEDVQYRLYVLDKIKRGQKDIKEGRTMSHEDVKNRLSAKWQN